GQTRMSPAEANLRELLDKQEIHERLMRYFRGADRCDAELVQAAFHDDAVATYGARTFRGSEIGVRIVEAVRSRHIATLHTAANELVELDGDVAHSETYAVNYHLEPPDGRRVLQRGVRYVDRFERRHGAWRIANRVVVLEWDRIDEIREQSNLTGYEPSRRSPEDLSY